MSDATRKMVRGWLAMHNGDVEGLVGWMVRTLRVGGRATCRAMILEASQEG